MSTKCIVAMLLATAASAAADPPPAPPPTPTTPPTRPAPTPPAGSPATGSPIVSSWVLMVPPPPPPVPSLRVEAARVANDRFEESWRYPDVEPLFGVDAGTWFLGTGRYQPRSARAAALHGGSMAATLLGEILLSADSPVAAAGALLTGATLDAAAAEADQHAEARR